MEGLTAEEQAVFDELKKAGYLAIPSRKSILSSPSLLEKRAILKRLVYKDLINFDFHIANGHDEADESCLVFMARTEDPAPDSDTEYATDLNIHGGGLKL